MGGEGGWPLLYNFKGRVGKTVIKRYMGIEGGVKNWQFYNMWMAPYSDMMIE